MYALYHSNINSVKLNISAIHGLFANTDSTFNDVVLQRSELQQ